MPVPTSPPSPARPSRASGALDWWLRNRRTGRRTLAQWPDPALWAWLVTSGAAWTDLLPGREQQLRWIGGGALIAWAADELFRGVNPARRTLGRVPLGWQVHRLAG